LSWRDPLAWFRPSWTAADIPDPLDHVVSEGPDPAFPHREETLLASARSPRTSQPAFADRWPDFLGNCTLARWMLNGTAVARCPLGGQECWPAASLVLPSPSESGGGSRGPTTVYLYQGTERFAIVTGMPSATVIGVWMIERRLFIYANRFAHEIMRSYCADRLGSLLRRHLPLRPFPSGPIPPREPWFLCEIHRNIGHSLYEELSYIDVLLRSGFRGRFASLGYDVFPVRELYPELTPRYTRFPSEEELNRAARRAGALVFRVAHHQIQPGTLERLRAWSPEGFEPPPDATGPGIWIGLRGVSPAANPRGICVNQVEAYAAVIRSALERHPGAWFVLDGVTTPWSAEPGPERTAEVRLGDELLEALGPAAPRVVSLVGAKADRKAAAARRCRFAVCAYGASLVFPAWIGDLEAVAYAKPEFLDRWTKNDMYTVGWKGNPDRTRPLHQYRDVELLPDGNYRIDPAHFSSFILDFLPPSPA
jgi:hypothetical protein